MICPRDNSPLQLQSMGDVSLHYCDQCFGMWFSRSDLKAMLVESKEQKYLPGLPEPLVTHDPDLDNTPCPVDHHSIMAHIDFEGVKLDVCRKHKGIWFDHGELMILYAAYLKETDGESFLKEDTRRFFVSLFTRREPLVITDEKKKGMSAFLIALNTVLAPFDIIQWLFTGYMISELHKDEEEGPATPEE